MWNKIDSAPSNEERFIALDDCGFYAVCYKDKCDGLIYVAWDMSKFEGATHWTEIPKFQVSV